MWPFRRKPAVEVPCCAEAALEPEDWNQELIDFGLDVIEALSRPSITGRS